MKILYWVTNLSGEIAAHLRYTLNNTNHKVLVAMDDAQLYRSEICQMLWPLKFDAVSRKDFPAIWKFGADVVVIDNHLPPVPVARSIFTIWHGWGWKGPQDREEFDTFHKKATRLVGRIDEPNPRFIWKAYGDTDDFQRVNWTGFARENVKNLGMAGGDDMVTLKPDKKQVLKMYGFNPDHRVLLLAPTWHHEGVFVHWGGDASVFEDLLAFADEFDFSILVRMHDRGRYNPEYITQLRKLISGNRKIVMKFKDESMDNAVDMLISDIMISNYSSIANIYYMLRRPVIHVFPFAERYEPVVLKVYTSQGLKDGRRLLPHQFWKVAPEDTGGTVAWNRNEMMDQLRQAATDPQPWAKMCDEYMQRHIKEPDGQTCRRITDEMEKMVNNLPAGNFWTDIPLLTARNFIPGMIKETLKL